MRVQTLRRFTLFVLNVTMAASLLAQGGRDRLYNPSTEPKVQGKVLTVDSVAGRHGWSGIQMKLESKDVKYDVHAGPTSGSEVRPVERSHRSPAKLARMVKMRVLRGNNGFSVWSGAGTASN